MSVLPDLMVSCSSMISNEIVVNGGTLMKELGFKPGPDLGRALLKPSKMPSLMGN